MDDIVILSLAETGYKAYCDYTGGKSLVSGDRLPSWDGLKPAIKNAWFAAANAIFEEAKAEIIMSAV